MKFHYRFGKALFFAFLVFMITQVFPPGHFANGQGVTITPINQTPPSAPVLPPAAPPAPAPDATTGAIAPVIPPNAPTAVASPDPTQNVIAGPTSTPDQKNPVVNGPNGGAMLPSANPVIEANPADFVPSKIETYVSAKMRQGDPRAILHTSMGDIVIRLFPNSAPQTVHNFIDLARGDKESTDPKTGKKVRRPFYNNLTFHRVVYHDLIQTGCPFGTGRGGPGYTIPDEISPASSFADPGMVAMSPQIDSKKPTEYVRDSNGSQFFITVAPRRRWDQKLTVFGKVEKGMAVVKKISRVRTGPTDRPIRKVFLNQIEIIDEATADAINVKKKKSKGRAEVDDDENDEDEAN